MKKIYIALAALSPLLLHAAPLSQSRLAGCKSAGVTQTIEAMRQGPSRVTVDELFACPENTVLDGPYIEDQIGYSGFQNSDQGRPGMSTRYFQAFHGCYRSVNEIRVIGMFNYFDEEEYEWLACLDRGGINDKYAMTEPVKFEIAFYRQDENGEPGELVFRQESDIIGRYLGVTYGSDTPLYEFRVALEQEMKLETGFMAFSAVNMGDSPSCWFSIFTADSSMDYAMIDMEGYGLMYANLPCIFSFMGDGSMAAQKALRIDKITAPLDNARGTHETVTVKVINAGEQPMSDATLELWVDGQRKATEQVPVTIASEASFDYTFVTRVDLSAPGEHTVEVRNVTSGDEGISKMKAVTSTYCMADGEYCESSCQYPEDDEVKITRVVVGSIDNSSEAEGYTDYSSTEGGVTELRPGQTLSLSVEPMGSNLTGVWIDWNNDGVFSGQGEEIGYIYDKPLDITIPEGLSVSEGLKRMRLVMDYSNEPQPCGSYYFGETEDYGILVKRNDNTPSVSSDIKEISEVSVDGSSHISSIEVSNVGNALLDASVNVSYKLPDVYEGRSLAPAGEFKSTLKTLKKTVASAPAVSAAKKAEQSQAAAEFVLRYDGGYSSSVQLGNFSSCIFANYYPREKMAALKGMQISSVEVYIKDLPGGTKIKVFGQGVDRAHSGAVLAEQEFEAQADSWNVVTLDNPVEITGEDIWFGVEMTDMSADKFHIGIDATPAVAGYGDVCNVGGETWWSMSDLGVDSNFCVRANVTGKRSAFIDWIHLDKTALSLGTGESAVVKATLDPAGLTDGMYEAAIEIRSNDELESVRAIPVYFANGVWASIDAVSEDVKSEIKLTADGIAVTSENAISEIRIVDLSGRVVSVDEVGATSAVVPVDALVDGVYVLSVSYVDGVVESMKFAIAR